MDGRTVAVRGAVEVERTSRSLLHTGLEGGGIYVFSYVSRLDSARS